MSVSYFNGLGLSRNLVRNFLALVDVGNGIVSGNYLFFSFCLLYVNKKVVYL